MGMEVDHLIYEILQFTITTIRFHKKYKSSLQLHQLNAHFLFINGVIERCLIYMKMHRMEYFKIHRKCSAVTKLKILDEMRLFYLFYFHTLNMNFRVRFNPDIANPSDIY